VLVSPATYWELLFATLALAVVLGVVVVRRRRAGRVRWLAGSGATVLFAAAAWLLAYSTDVVIVTDRGTGAVAAREIWLGASDHYHETFPSRQPCGRVPTWVVNESSRELGLQEIGAIPLTDRIPAGATACAGGIDYLGPDHPPPVTGMTAPRFGRWLTW
jgi:hypothetical protein